MSWIPEAVLPFLNIEPNEEDLVCHRSPYGIWHYAYCTIPKPDH
jgi:hypothetical protein